MALTTAQIEGMGQVQFDPDLFDEEDLAGFASLASLDLTFDAGDEADFRTTVSAGAPFTPQEAEAEIRRQIEAGEFLPDLMAEAEAELGRKPSADELLQGSVETAQATLNGFIAPDVERAVAAASLASLVEIDGKYAVEIDGDVILALDPQGPLGATANVIAAIVVVLIDLVFVVLAIIGVAAARSKSVAAKVAKVTRKYGEKFLKMLKMMLQAMKSVMAAVRDAPDKAAKGKAARAGAADIGRSVFAALKYSYDHLWSEIREVLGAFVSGAWNIIKTCASLAVSILTWVASAGAVLAAAIINLILAVVDLVMDCVKLAKAIA